MRLLIGNKNYSSWSMRPWLLMRHADIEFEEVRITLFTQEGEQQLKQLSPTGMVPVLLLEDQKIWDSLAICETIAERYPDRGLWPIDTRSKAIARSACAEMHSGFTALRSELPMNCRSMKKTPELSSAAESDIERVTDLLTELLGASAPAAPTEERWLHGANYTITDAMFAPVISRFNTYQIDCPDPVKSYATQVLSDPPMKSWYADAAMETEIIEQAEI